MKVIIIQLLLLCTCHHLFSQSTITGNWHSADSSRIYKIYKKENCYEAILASTKRKNESPGELILGDLTYDSRKNYYKGYIRAVTNGMIVLVKIRIENNGNTLKLKLQRMMLFPVYLQWTKAN